jgi:hypothetical protein
MSEELFALRLRKLHEESRMSQEDLVADIMARTGKKINQTSYSYYMKGTKTPTYPAVETLCEYYGVSFEWITGKVDDRRTVKELLRIVDETGITPQIRNAARQLATLPKVQRDAITASIEAAAIEQENHRRSDERWQQLSAWIGKVDTDGSLSAFVKAETGRIVGDVSSGEPVGELGD